MIVFLVLIILISLSGALLLLSRPEPIVITIKPPPPTATPKPSPTPRPILVYVSGEVSQRGTQIFLPYGSRVSDAVAAAGGFTDLANKELVNLAGMLRDGDQVHVPAIGTDIIDSALPTPSGGKLVRVNSALQEELETLPRVGPAMAQRIIEYREQVGPFSTLADLDQVSGIGPLTLEALEDLIAFD
ncbi:MAG: helix-hairpin-helix domain-containing protein [Chloroflexota bacterium]|nr:helix-hairpin-helix domain-containing protein [Chloroflexota bacterium]